MFHKNFRLDPDTLRLVQVKKDLKSRILTGFLFGFAVIFLTAGIIKITDKLDIRLKYRHLKNVNSSLVEKYNQLCAEMDKYDRLLAEYQVTDDSIYRCILDIPPIPEYARRTDFGGSNPYEDLQGFPSSPLMISTSLRLDKIKMRTDLQNSSFEDINRLAFDRKTLLSSKPAIQPIALDATFWLSSDFGYRIDPFTHRRAFHEGMDYASEPGLNVYSTGDGVVEIASNSKYGYGREIIINHGFGYTSRYAHLLKILVEPGQNVKRGQLIGLLGNTGRSTGPHLHYGVNFNDKAVNPYFYYSNDLSPQEYSKILSSSE